ncbi:hypothetical protein J6TS7_18190 [Paenibacillus dendritiformis]|nr:hypothetical protein J6TS7_18190 [Paenibacillus dendritiformis]
MGVSHQHEQELDKGKIVIFAGAGILMTATATIRTSSIIRLLYKVSAKPEFAFGGREKAEAAKADAGRLLCLKAISC